MGGLEDRPACCSTAHRSGECNDVAGTGAGTQNSWPAVERTGDRSGDDYLASSAEVSPDHPAAVRTEFTDGRGQSVREILHPGNFRLAGKCEAHYQGRGPAAHRVYVAEVLGGSFPADIESGCPVPVGPLETKVHVLYLGVDGNHHVAVRRSENCSIIAGTNDDGVSCTLAVRTRVETRKDPLKKAGFAQFGDYEWHASTVLGGTDILRRLWTTVDPARERCAI